MSREVIETVLAYIDQHIYEKISLADLSGLAGYSPFYFSTLFSEIIGVSVTTYIRTRKLQYAMASLLKGEKIVDISFQYAFESHEGFTRSFTKLFGSTPKTARKYLTTYTVPPYVIPDISFRKDSADMNITKDLLEDMHQILFTFLQEALSEAALGHCTELSIHLLPNNQIRLADNGRGLPLSDDPVQNQELFSKILAGHPITSLDYARMEELDRPGFQVASSLCESLHVSVYRNAHVYRQAYIRGIAQHAIKCDPTDHASGMEVVLLPDREIFGEAKFSETRIRQWLEEHLTGLAGLTVTVERSCP